MTKKNISKAIQRRENFWEVISKKYTFEVKSNSFAGEYIMKDKKTKRKVAMFYCSGNQLTIIF